MNELIFFFNSQDDESHCTQYISIFILSFLVDHLEGLNPLGVKQMLCDVKVSISYLLYTQVKGEMPEGKKIFQILFSLFRSWNYKGGSLMTLSLTVLLFPRVITCLSLEGFRG